MMRYGTILFLFAVVCGISRAQTPEVNFYPDNEGCVLYLSLAPELVYDDTTSYRGLSATPPPSQAIVTSEPSPQPQIAFLLAAFPPKAHPQVRLTIWGIRYPKGIHVVRSGLSRYGMHLVTPDWPLSGEGMIYGPGGAPDTGRVFEVGWIAIQADKPGLFELVPHPETRMGGRIVASDPPLQVTIADFGYLGFGMPGRAPEPHEASPPLGAACVGDSLCLELSRPEADYYAARYAARYAEAGGLFYLGDAANCREGPCGPNPMTGACCLPGGRCESLSARDCAVQGGGYQGADTACSPDACLEEGTLVPEREGEKP